MPAIYTLFRLSKLVRYDRLKLLYVYAAQKFGWRYYSVRLDPVLACNLRCRMCHFSSEKEVDRARFTPEEIDRIADQLFGSALQLVIGCGAEPTLYRDFIGIVRLAKRHGIPSVGLVTNGQLLNGNDLKELISAGLDELIISIHGVSQATYESFMVGARYNRLMELLEGFEAIRKEMRAGRPSLRVNYTANPDNIAEAIHFFDVFGRFSVDTLQVRPIMDIGGEYFNPFTPENVDNYNYAMRALKRECENRRVRLLANLHDPSFTATGGQSMLYGELYKYVSPGVVVDRDFDWRNESYSQYLKRKGWGRDIRRKILLGKSGEQQKAESGTKHIGQYDIFG